MHLADNRPADLQDNKNTARKALVAFAAATAALATLISHPCHGAPPLAAAHDRSTAIRIPATPVEALLPRARIATDLANPRGLLALADGTLMVALAGEGLENDPGTGSLTLLHDKTGDGIYETRADILNKLPSKNILELVRRDEVFGMADIAYGNNITLVSAAFFGGPSQIYEVSNTQATPWATVNGNINDLAYSEKENAWFAVSSSSEQLLQVSKNADAVEILEIPDLPEGQDPVPGYIQYEPTTGDVLVSLFSGSPLGEEGGDGTEIVKAAGGIIRVNTSDASFEWVVSGLTAPTDIALDSQGRLYILEFCSDFLDPVTTRQEMRSATTHGGFKRFSGRLMRVDLQSAKVELLADGLDGPTNLYLTADAIYVAQGMGTPGRPIPRGTAEIPLTGFIEKLTLN